MADRSLGYWIEGLLTKLNLIAAIPLTLALFFLSIRSRELSVYINPARTIIAPSGQRSDLHFVYKGHEVTTDVTAIQVGLWNAGNEPIRTEHILEPIIIETVPKVPILDAEVHFVTRRVVGPNLDTKALADGALGVSWKILEPNDGMVIQLVVAGPTRESLICRGLVEGQRSIKTVEHRAFLSTNLLIPCIGLLILMIAANVFEKRMAARRDFSVVDDDKYERQNSWRTFIFWVVIVSVTFSFSFFVGSASPPVSPLRFDMPVVAPVVADDDEFPPTGPP